MWKEFKEFAFKGNVVDMAVGVMIGAAFGKIVTGVVNDLFMPVLTLLTGKIDFSKLFIAMDGQKYATIEAAQEANVATLNYGSFISTVIDFFLIALCIFFFVKMVNKLKNIRKHEEVVVEEAPKTKVCPYCMSEIPTAATRCPACTSILDESIITKE